MGLGDAEEEALDEAEEDSLGEGVGSEPPTNAHDVRLTVATPAVTSIPSRRT